ncbi:MAG: hypothetical protein IJW50_03955 [Clostridia bacterium]|nr:hypothetical protein [Clostridia bacterium]
MKGINTWSHTPYRPFLTNVGEPYICRIAPSNTAIHFEWLDTGDTSYSIFYRVRGKEPFLHASTVTETSYDLTELAPDTDYEFFVTAGEKKSRVRLARCGKSIGTVVNYLHPDDEAYAFSGRYLCSPSLVRHPDGYLLASMDLYAAGYPQNLTLIFRSDDNGASWHYISELMPCFWGKLFLHRGDLYMLACSTEYGDLLIGKSTDGGKTFSAPVTLLRGANGKNGSSGVHKNPQNIFRHNGRIYETLEWGSWSNKEYCHAAMVMSCDENDDLLCPENWHFSKPLPFSQFDTTLSELPNTTMTIEGTLALSPDGTILNIMRFGKYHHAIAYEVNSQDPDAPLEYSHCIRFPANYSKFMIKYDEISQRYYSIGTIAYNEDNTSARDYLALLVSQDLEHWEVTCDLHDYRGIDPEHIGFQYVDFEFDGEDLIYLCRTALNGAHNFHDANYSTFHRIRKFRNR